MIKYYIDKKALKLITNTSIVQLLDKSKVNFNGFIMVELWYENGEFNPVLVKDSRSIIHKYMIKDVTLTQKIEHDFKNTYTSGTWAKWREEWLKDNGFKIGRSSNTYNFLESVTDFEFTHFIAPVEGLVIMWHDGKYIRHSYSYPEVWIGDVEGFLFDLDFDEKDEMSYLLGYNGDWDTLIKDLQSLIKRKRYRKKKYYVGYPMDNSRLVIFSTNKTLMRNDYPEYGCIIGPFRTRKEAENFIKKS